MDYQDYKENPKKHLFTFIYQLKDLAMKTCCEYYGLKDGCSQGKYCPATYLGDRFVGIVTTVIFVIWVVCIAVGVPL